MTDGKLVLNDTNRNILKIGETYGNIIVLEYVGYTIHKSVLKSGKNIGRVSKSYLHKWKIKCKLCGHESIMTERAILRLPDSCGCNKINLAMEAKKALIEKGVLKRPMGTYENGKRKRLYEIWYGMKSRCNKPNSSVYKHYGARGIKICPEWDDPNTGYINFENWAYENGYSEEDGKRKMTLERLDFDKDYCPENCVWAGKKENQYIQQANNTRNNTIVEWGGVKYTLSEIARHFGISKDIVYDRMEHGRTLPEALLIPKDRYDNKGNPITINTYIKKYGDIKENPNAINPLISTLYKEIDMNDPKLFYYTQNELAKMRNLNLLPQEIDEDYQKAREAAKQSLRNKLGI